MRFTIALALVSASSALAAPMLALKRADGGNAYTGNGGSAVGGTNTAVTQGGAGEGGVADNAEVLNLFSDNAGDGGKAKSGDSFGGHGSTSASERGKLMFGYAWVNGYWVPVGGKGGDAYTGLGGNANGGNKGEWTYGKRCFNGACGPYGYGWRHEGGGIADNLKLGNVATGNAGSGGDASSGNSYGGNGAAAGQFYA